MKNEKGFSLIELLIVVAIIGIIAAMAIPSLQKAKLAAQSGSAIQTLRSINTAETLFERSGSGYGVFSELGAENLLDPAVTSGIKSGYDITLIVGDIFPGDKKHFAANADPQEDNPQAVHYFVDETSVIRFEIGTGNQATATSEPIPR